MPPQIYARGEIIAEHYLVLEHRRGGQGDVYLTFDLQPLERTCRALKTLHLDGGWSRERRAVLHREAAAWVSLGAHPDIVRCFLATDVRDVPYLVLEWVADEESRTRSLREVMQHGPVDPRGALHVASHLCAALLHCRGRLAGFAHGDIKPENLLIGEHSSVKLTDFGLARTAFNARGEAEGQGWGTPHYTAPELWAGGTPDERTDIYAVGCLMYELFEGELPFPGRTFSSVRRAHLEDDPPPPSLMTRPVWELIRRCLSKEAADRPAGYEELADMVGALTGRPRTAGPPPAARPTELTATDYGNQAHTLLQTGHYEEALAAFDKALALDPNLSRAYNNRALLYYKMGRDEEALRDWARAVELDPEFVEVFGNRAAFHLDRGRYELGLEDARRAVELNDRWPTGLLNLASALNQLKRHEEALVHVDRALELRPDNAQLLILRGQVLAALGRYAEGVESYTEALSQEGLPRAQFHQAYMQLIPCLTRAGQEAAAYAAVDAVVDSPEVAAFLGKYFLHLDEPLLALRALRQARPEDEGVREASEGATRRLVEMTVADDPRVTKYRSYRYWCEDPEKMIEDLAEALHNKVPRDELGRALDVLADPAAEAAEHPLLRDPAFREACERVVFPRISQMMMSVLIARFIMLERGA
jgi:tetratricopeptide (TPR) repeat protein